MIKTYKLFTITTCPKCPQMKEHMATKQLPGELINASEPEGMQEARKYSISQVPTVIFFDEEINITGIAHDKEEVDKLLEENK